MANDNDLDLYIKLLNEALGQRDRHRGLTDYCRGLMFPFEEKSVEPTAAHADQCRASSRHQSLHHVVAQPDLSDDLKLGLSEEGEPFRGSGPTILRANWQTGKLSGGGEFFSSERTGEPSGLSPVVSVEGMGG